MNCLQVSNQVSAPIGTNKIFNLLLEADESISILECLITSAGMISELVKVLRKVGTKHAALIANPCEYLKYFNSNPSFTDDFAASCEAYLVQVLKRNTTCITMDQFRVYIYHHSKGITLNQLPPTSYAIQQHIRRAYYATIKW